MNPRYFLDQFVMPTVHEWNANRLDVRKATLAVCQLDIFAERFIAHTWPDRFDDLPHEGRDRDRQLRPLEDHITAERDRRGITFPPLAVLRDMHKSHRHGLLRSAAIIRSDQRPELHCQGGPLGSMALGEAAIGGTADYLLIVDDGGRRHRLDHLIPDCLRYWRGELDLVGL